MSKPQLNLKIPGNIDACRIRHFNAFKGIKDIADIWNPTIVEKITMNALFLGMSEDEMMMVDLKSNGKLFSKICKTFASYTPPDTNLPPVSVTYEVTDKESGKTRSQKYILAKDFTTMPTKWYVDSSRYDMIKEPARIAAMCYIEEGMSYAEQGPTKNILNKSADRMKVFEEQMPLSVYIDVATFFLRSYVEWKGSSIQIESRQSEIKQMQQTLSHLNGSLQSLRSQRSSS
jgi:hypothetical protein